MATESEDTRVLYNRIALKYHAKRANPAASQWNDFLESPGMERVLRPLCAGREILDLGCGTGILTAKLIGWGARSVRGIEPAEEMLAIGRAALPAISLDLGSAESLPYGDASFDVVASSLVLHYIQDLTPAFSEVGRVLRPGGHFVFSMHHPFEEILDRDPGEPGRVTARPYFSNDPYYWPMCGEQMRSFHHTLGHIVNGLSAHGMVLCAVDECRPSEDVAAEFDEYAYTSAYPPFCVFKARKL